MSLNKISDIEKVKPDWYNPSFPLSRDDQEYLWENTPFIEPSQTPNYVSGSVNALSENANGSCKSFIDWALNCKESKVLLSLEQSNSDTPPIELEALLKEIFLQWPSKEGHWLWVAQRYTARSINRQLVDTLKQCLRGAIRKTPPSYFTYGIKHRKRRKQLK